MRMDKWKDEYYIPRGIFKELKWTHDCRYRTSFNFNCMNNREKTSVENNRSAILTPAIKYCVTRHTRQVVNRKATF